MQLASLREKVADLKAKIRQQQAGTPDDSEESTSDIDCAAPRALSLARSSMAAPGGGLSSVAFGNQDDDPVWQVLSLHQLSGCDCIARAQRDMNHVVPFMYRISCCGHKAITFAASNNFGMRLFWQFVDLYQTFHLPPFSPQTLFGHSYGWTF